MRTAFPAAGGVVRLPCFLGYNRRMRILLSNDDGYLAPGIDVLHEAMQPLGEVTVMAPEQNCSGTSNSLTLSRPLSIHQAANGFNYVNGTPTDSVHIALTGMLDEKPDLVVSGINNGQNVGDDTLYSGTVAAATEGFMFGIPAIAFSLVGRDWLHLDDAARVAAEIVAHYPRASDARASAAERQHPEPALRSAGRVASDAARQAASVAAGDPPDRSRAAIRSTGSGRRATRSMHSEGTDFHAVANGHVSITPLQLDSDSHGFSPKRANGRTPGAIAHDDERAKRFPLALADLVREPRKPGRA